MQAIAREFNLSETVFVLPARLPAHTAYIRIFTPFTELQFAGHPTVGAAIQLADDRISGAAADCDALVVLEEGIGKCPCWRGWQAWPGALRRVRCAEAARAFGRART